METNQTPPANKPVRPPNPAELDQLWGWMEEIGYASGYDMTRESICDVTWIAVFDDYATDGPGYAGRLLYLVWGGSPTTPDVFTFDRNDRLVHVATLEHP